MSNFHPSYTSTTATVVPWTRQRPWTWSYGFLEPTDISRADYVPALSPVCGICAGKNLPSCTSALPLQGSALCSLLMKGWGWSRSSTISPISASGEESSSCHGLHQEHLAGPSPDQSATANLPAIEIIAISDAEFPGALLHCGILA